VTADTVGVLDTSTLLLIDRLDADSLPAEPVITAVTLAELSVGPLVASDDEGRLARQLRLQQVEASFDPLPFDVQAARSFGGVAASLGRSGRKAKARAFDAMIAATAIANNMALYTCNQRDFDGIDGLRLKGIPHPDEPG
jgi:predicted nucleic acid-binding protein